MSLSDGAACRASAPDSPALARDGAGTAGAADVTEAAGPGAGAGEATMRGGACPASCLHCGQALERPVAGGFCCHGCAAVYRALSGSGLLRYYALRGAAAEPVGDAFVERAARPKPWLSPIVESLGSAREAVSLRLQLQGIRCAACVWLIDQVCERARGLLAFEINPATGSIALRARREFDLAGWVDDVERFGYLVGPAPREGDPAQDRSRDGLLLRAGLCTVFSLNAMMFAAAVYLGLEAGPLRTLLSDLNFGFATLSVLVGGPVFFNGLVFALRQRLFHLDLPIAFGIATTYAAAIWSYFGSQTGIEYYDSLSVFIALMLWGRYLQERTITASRARLLRDAGSSGLHVRSVVEGRVERVPVEQLAPGERILVPPGELLPVAAELIDTAASCSLASIDGEPAPRTFAPGERVPAGAVNAGRTPLFAIARERFADSQLVQLLAAPVSGRGRNTGTRAVSALSAAYVLTVLGVATLGFLYAFRVRGDWADGLATATAICVVTCPCSIGIALPLGHELLLARLRRLGLFVRNGGFLGRAARVQRVVFDKTGTLTDGHLHLTDVAPLAALGSRARRALYVLTQSSAHPRSQALARAVTSEHPLDARMTGGARVEEAPGAGVFARMDGHSYRLGSAAFCDLDRAGQAGAYFTCDDRLLAVFHFRERLRPAAAREVAALAATGYEIHVLSGDRAERVARMAAEAGIDAARAHGELTPQDKADWLAGRAPERCLMVGDGLNDSLALERAGCAGTPALDSPAACTRSDFYFTTPGLSPVRAALLAARDLSRMTRRNWGFLLGYNALAVTAAFGGVVTPWVAAVVMPASSIVSVVLTVTTLERWSRRWTS